MTNDLVSFWLPALISGVGGFFIYKSMHAVTNKRSEKQLYQRSHLYAVIMEDKRARGESLDDLLSGFELRDRWYGLKGIKFEDKTLLILAGYTPENAKEAHAENKREELKIQAHLRTGYLFH
jgi:hypothetical protein